MAKRLRGLAVLCVAVAFVLACHVAAPALYAAEDAALMDSYLPRRRLEGRLSADALDIFLVRRLHERAGDPVYNGYQRVENEQRETAQAMAGFVEECRALLGEENTAALLVALAGGEALYTSAEDSYGFVQYLCDFGDAQGMMGVEYDPLSGAVVRLWVQSRVYDKMDTAGSTLAQYNAMLQTDTLPDWQAGSGYYNATLTSGDAGLMLYVYDKDSVFQLGVEVLGRGSEATLVATGGDADETMG